MAVWTGDCSFVTGAAREHLVGVALMLDDLAADKVPHSKFNIWTGKGWADDGDSKWKTVGMTFVTDPELAMVCLGEWGKAWIVTKKPMWEETVSDGKVSTQGRGPLRTVRTIDGMAWAAGMDRQVYRREAKNTWVCLDAQMRPKKSSKAVGFEAIAGASEKDVYAAGWGGEIWHYDGKDWEQIDSPTNKIITGLAYGAGGKVYACGRMGLLMVGKGSKWKVLEQEGTAEDLFGIAFFKGKLYVASLEQLLVLEGDELKPVEFEDERPETYNHLAASDELLWSIGPKDLFKFDGKEWERVD